MSLCAVCPAFPGVPRTNLVSNKATEVVGLSMGAQVRGFEIQFLIRLSTWDLKKR